MKIIELLNKIAKGEIPKRIIYDKYVYQWNNKIRNYEREVDINTTLNWDYIAIECLNAEVEILEEEKKIPETINNWTSAVGRVDDSNIEEYIHKLFEQQTILYFKVNYIIDYLKSKGE